MGTFFLFFNTGASLKVEACENEDKTQELTSRVTQLVYHKNEWYSKMFFEKVLSYIGVYVALNWN